jgi:hypothetical protein
VEPRAATSNNCEQSSKGDEQHEKIKSSATDGDASRLRSLRAD